MRWPIIIRKISGISMVPDLSPGQIIFAISPYRKLRVGDIIVFTHDNTEKIKRIAAIDEHGIHVRGDNSSFSTDSRHFGPIPPNSVRAMVITTF